MSFRASAQKVRNPELPIWRRLVELRHCFSITYAPDGYHAMVQRYDDLYGFNRYRPRTDPPTEAQLLTTLEALEQERSVLAAMRQGEAQQTRDLRLAYKNAQRASAPSYLFGMPCATREQFERTIAKPKPTLVSVMASWDDSSARLSFVLRRWKAGTQQWRWLMVDCDQESALCQGLNIATTPALFVFQQGKLLAQRQGIFCHQGTDDEHYQTFRDWLETAGAVE